jgi:hypothetical protein
MTGNAAARPAPAQAAAEPWIALVQAGLLVGKYSGEALAGARAATHLAVADGRDIEVYEVDPQVSPPDPPIGTEVVPALWGWKRLS